MKYFIIYAIVLLTLVSCVQKTKTQKVTLFLDVSGIKDIKTVGVRGEGKPLSWNEDLRLEEVKKDSLFKISFIGNTGKLCTELKFSVNGELELQDKDNRKLYFNKSGITIFNAKFNVAK